VKKILIVATGGTIASSAGSHGLTPTLTGEELVGYVPQVRDLCNFEIVQAMNIDSTNMQPNDWLRIADTIMAAYDDFDGFVILHGTDTMAYTAAALSYLIQDSPKPIVLTGSQQPMSNPFTDAKLNLYQSLLYACQDDSSDVSVVFDGRVIVGTRAHKQRTMSFNAFTSVNYPLPAIIRNDRVIRESHMGMSIEKDNPPRKESHLHSILRPRRPRVYHELDDHVVVLRLTPGLGPEVLDALFAEFDAVILEVFGIGGIPETDDAHFEKAILGWTSVGKYVVMTTQVSEEGLDLGVYEVGSTYLNRPRILLGGDMTTEALVAKTMWVLGQSNDPRKAAQLFYQPINHDRASDD
jgi:L-asparaginase